jgi:hypothetical protein
MTGTSRKPVFACLGVERLSIAKLFAVVLAFSAANAPAALFYVDAGSTNPTPPYADWSTAATNIQDAIDAASAGDLVWVTNGVYQFGGKAMVGTLTNRVTLDKPLTVQGVNGPLVTTVLGAGATNGPAAVRCAWLTNGAVLIGFTLRAGATQTSGNQFTTASGGGAWCASSNALVANCVITSNAADNFGGGVYGGTVRSCLIVSNSTRALGGGGACDAILNNCTVAGNSGGGLYRAVGQVICTNCIIYFNQIGNYPSSTLFSYCCTTPLPSGPGCFTNAPQLLADNLHLATSSPCRGAGTNMVTGTDLLGQPWNNPPSIGCIEFVPAPVIFGPPQIQLTGTPVGFTIGAIMGGGQEPLTCFWTRDGTPLENDGHYSSAYTTNLVATGVSQYDAGNYQVVVSNSFGMATSGVAQLVGHFVNGASASPAPPYLGWSTAATNIQDAINASATGDIVLVTNGVYASGGKSMDGVITNSISVDRGLIVQSVNGALSTIIQGAWDPATNGPGAVRCAWLTNNAILSGFTLRGGATRVWSVPTSQSSGGGVWGVSTSAVVANCLISGNSAGNSGGGAYKATLTSCTVLANSALGDGHSGTSSGNGGGAELCVLRACLVTGNSAHYNGGGAENCNCANCAFTLNRAIYGSGAAAYKGTLVSCTVVSNTAGGYVSSFGGAVASASLTDCIVYGNVGIGSPVNYTTDCVFTFSDTDPLPTGAGNLDTDPRLLADGYHLSATSPCIGAGTNSGISGTDIDGQPWHSPPSIGCDEWQPQPVVSALSFQIGPTPRTLNLSVIAAGQAPLSFFWTKDGSSIQDGSHYSGTGTANLAVSNFGPDDGGGYLVVVSNSFGVATSQVLQVGIHGVNVAGLNPVPPYSSWATAATNIQDAIDAALAGEIVLVTNGLYASGGKATAGPSTSRVVVDKPLTVTSVNGYTATVIQGAWDPSTTNGPLAVRCAWLTDGAALNGFTLQNGATSTNSSFFVGDPTASGGGVWCNSANGVLSDCLLTNNSAAWGGGIIYGTLDNCLVINNTVSYPGYGAGCYSATLNNCTVRNNYLYSPFTSPMRGAGIYNGTVRNCIIVKNFDVPSYSFDDWAGSTVSLYSCLDFQPGPGLPGTNNIYSDPQFLDSFRIPSTSPCRGAGSSLYASGTDLDGEFWANPPSMGCDEVVLSNRIGPLSVGIIIQSWPPPLANHFVAFGGMITGSASRVSWSFGDGTTVTNVGISTSHKWTNAGDYTVTFIAYNTDTPGGVSSNLLVHVSAVNPVRLQSVSALSNQFQFQFTGQDGAFYSLQYATNLASPVSWQFLKYPFSTGSVYLIQDPLTNKARFYRVVAQ